MTHRHKLGVRIKKATTRSLILAFIMGIVFVWGETMIRVFLPPGATAGDKPLYEYNPNMSFYTLAGYSSIWMLLIAMTFSMALGGLNDNKGHSVWPSYRVQAICGFLFILTLEFCSGWVLNRVCKLDVWDYSMFHLNLYGQIALIPALMWALLTPSIFFTDDLIRYYIWGGPKPDRFITYYTNLFKSGKIKRNLPSGIEELR